MAATPRATRGRKATARPTAPVEDARIVEPVDSTAIDGVLDDWSQNTAKEQIAWEIQACTTVLRHAQTLREAQLDAARHAQEAHEQAAEQLKKARGLSELAAVQLALARADAEGALHYWSKLGEVTTRGALDMLSDSATGVAKLQTAAWSALLQWSKLQASLPQSAEVFEAEVEHVTNPVTSSPLVWPAQEATRQAFTLAANTWNDWLSWSGDVANAATGANGGARLH